MGVAATLPELSEWTSNNQRDSESDILVESVLSHLQSPPERMQSKRNYGSFF